MNELYLCKNSIGLRGKGLPGCLIVFVLIMMWVSMPSILQAQTAFIPGNLVVEQVGDGSTSLSSSASAINFLEFTTSSSQTNPVQTVSAPSSTIVESGTSSSDGHLTLSADGTSLVFVAYGASVGTATVTSNTTNTITREVGFVNRAGTSSIATFFDNAAGQTGAFKNSNIRGAYFDGTYIWASGDDGSGNNTSSIHASTITTGSGSITTANNIAINSNSPSTSSNGVYVYKGQLYITANSSNGIYSVGTGKPTSTSTTAASVVTGLTGNPYDAVFLNTGNTNLGHPDLIYATDGSHIYKYYYNGSAWVAAGSYTPNAYGLVAHATTAGNISLYFVVNQGTSGNSIEKIVDATGRTGSISGSGSPATIATAGSDYAFDGISWAPSQASTISATNYSSSPANGTTISGGNYGNITIASGVTATLGGNIYINGTLTVQNGGTLVCGNHFVFSPEGSYGTFNVQSGGTLEMGDDSGIYNYASGGNIQTFSRFYDPGANYIYNGTVAQVTGDGLPASLTGNLTISNTMGVTLSQSVATTGSTTIGSGALLMVSATNTLGGALTDNGTIEVTAVGNASDLATQYSGTLTLTSGTALFAGASAQQIGAETVKNLSLNNSTGLSLTGNVSVSGTLTLTSGKITLGSNKLTIGSSGSIAGAGSSNYIYVNGTGVLEMQANNSGVLFPIGDDYNPITITTASGTGTFDVSVTDDITDATNTPSYINNVVNRTWGIDYVSGSASVIQVAPQWNDPTDILGTFDETNVMVASRTSLTTAWNSTQASTPAVAVSGGNYTVLSGNINASPGNTYYIGAGSGTYGVNPLPVDLLSFDAGYNNGAVTLKWFTASEQNNSYFEIERSLNAESWSSIGTVEGHGTTQIESNYSFIDPLTGVIPAGDIYYRLKQVDFNGRFTYSNINAVKLQGIQNVIYPNPATSVMTLALASDIQQNATINLIDINGKVIQSNTQYLMTGNNSVKIDLGSVPDGNYLVKVIMSSSVQCYRFMKVN